MSTGAPMGRRAFAAGFGLLLSASACDALVGGVCADGFVERDEGCVPMVMPRAGGDGATGAGGGGPAVECTAPLTACGATCVDVTSDVAHCGGCGANCPSGICEDGICIGERAGHVSVIGMDFRTVPTGSAQAVILGNAVFLAGHEPVRVLDVGDPSLPGVPRVLVQSEAAARGRTVSWLAGTSKDVPAALASGQVDVLMVRDQLANADVLGAVGASWAPAVDAFVARGGVIVALPGGTAGGMAALLTESHILSVQGFEGVDGQELEVEGWLDALGQDVVTPFLARPSTAAIITDVLPQALLSFVVVSSDGVPVVIHRAVAPQEP